MNALDKEEMQQMKRISTAVRAASTDEKGWHKWLAMF